jgi:hypothetical protein
MARSRKARKAHRRHQPSYRSALLKSINALVDRKALAREVSWKAKCWVPWRLLVAGLLMAWADGASLKEKFAETQIVMGQVFARTKRGKSYQGFIKALLRAGPLLDWVRAHLRQRMVVLAGPYWLRHGYCALAVDGSRVECPRTAANERELGCAGKKRTTPQLFLTTVYHLGTGLPWSYQIGPGTDSERNHLRAMLGRLPDRCLLVADAGFVGYELVHAIQRRELRCHMGRLKLFEPLDFLSIRAAYLRTARRLFGLLVRPIAGLLRSVANVPVLDRRAQLPQDSGDLTGPVD